MGKRKFVRVHLRWNDSVGPIRYWEPSSDISHQATTIDTVGWLVNENKRSVTVASSVSNSGCYGGILTIPKVAIVKRSDG